MMRGGVQIDVVTSAKSYDLVDLTTIKTLLNVTDASNDAFLGISIQQASGIAAKYCNNPFVIEAIVSSYWPTRDGWPWVVRDQISPLQLPRWPLTDVASVVETIDGVQTTLVSGTDYIVDLRKGQLTRLGRNGYPRDWSLNPIVVTFSAGYSTIPGDVVSAIASIVKGQLFAQSRDPQLRSENIEGVYEAQYWSGAGPGNSDQALPPTITGLLDQYRIPVFG